MHLKRFTSSFRLLIVKLVKNSGSMMHFIEPTTHTCVGYEKSAFKNDIKHIVSDVAAATVDTKRDIGATCWCQHVICCCCHCRLLTGVTRVVSHFFSHFFSHF